MHIADVMTPENSSEVVDNKMNYFVFGFPMNNKYCWLKKSTI